jgi:ABC-2 type transport system permease protein
MASELRVFFRNKLALFWMIVFPLLLFTILFGAFGGPSNLGTLRMEIADRDGSIESRQFIALLKGAFAAAQVVDLELKTSTTGNEPVPPGEMRISIPPGFGQAVQNTQAAVIAVSVGKGNTFAQNAAIGIILGANAEYNVAVARLPERSRIVVAQTPSDRAISYGQYLAVGVVVMTIVSTCLMGFTIPIVAQREQGILNTYSILPVTRTAVLGAFAVSRMILILAFVVLFTIFVKTIFHIEMPLSAVSLPKSLVIVILVTWIFLALGLIVAGEVRNVASAGAITNLIYFALVFLGNLIVPFDRFPEWIKAVIAFLPSTLAASSLRDTLFRSEIAGIESDLTVIFALVLWALACTTAATRRFRWSVT